ncbi:glycosyltransferase [bacterium]
MKINILFGIQSGPWGGGNQFIKALQNQFIAQNIYEQDTEKAEVILFNANPSNIFLNHLKVYKIKKRNPDKIIVLRLDGPVSLVRGADKIIDFIIKIFADIFIDGIIFQSHWSRDKNKKNFKINAAYETVISNACDLKIFNVVSRRQYNPEGKIKLLATSWSNNLKKGFKIYKYLDDNLDFNKYKMTFVGNSPIRFKNIKHVLPQLSKELAKIVKENDIYITASKDDPCSNSLIEALSCGLPVAALNSGGHPELVKDAGELFRDENDVIEQIEKVKNNYSNYQSKINVNSIDAVSDEYINFMENIFDDAQANIYMAKKINFKKTFVYLYMLSLVLWWKIGNYIKLILNAFGKRLIGKR